MLITTCLYPAGAAGIEPATAAVGSSPWAYRKISDGDELLGDGVDLAPGPGGTLGIAPSLGLLELFGELGDTLPIGRPSLLIQEFLSLLERGGGSSRSSARPHSEVEGVKLPAGFGDQADQVGKPDARPEPDSLGRRPGPGAAS